MSMKLNRLTPLLAPGWVRYLLLLSGVLAAVALYLLATASANTRLFSQHYPLILAVNGALAAGLIALFVYQLIRLRRRLRDGVFGARLSLRLVTMFALMAVLPGAILYAVSVQFLGRSIESWFDVRLETALDGGLSLGRNALDTMLKDLGSRGEGIAASLALRTPAEQVAALNELREQAGVQEATLYSSQGRMLGFSGNEKAGLMPEAPPAAVMRQIRGGRAYSAVEAVPDRGLYLRVIVPLQSLSLADGARTLQLVQPVPDQLARDAESVQAGVREYQELVLARVGLKRLYAVTLTLTLLLALLTALSLAFLLSEQLSAPLATLAQGTRAVARGDFSQRVAVTSRDELGVLSQSFNAMTQQLEEAHAAADLHRTQLAAANAYLESLLANLSAGVLAFDDGQRLRSFNPSAAAIMGIDPERLADAPLARWGEREPAMAPLARELVAAFEGGTAEWQREIELATPEGERVLLVRGTRLAVGSESGFVVVFDDITHVLQAQRAAAWSEVARRLAHEIKNPLTPIQLSAERLQLKLASKLAGPDADMLVRSTDTIVNQVATLKKMVDAFRDYGRMPEPAMQAVDVNALLREVLNLYGSLASSLRLELEEGLPAAFADPAQLRQVIHNLLQNAQDALAGTGEPLITVRTELQGAAVRVSVTDNGAGFPETIMRRVFEPYVTTKPKGTGLGLAVVRKIIEEHGGRIEVENIRPHGARVAFSLPAVTAALKKTAAQM
jgi:nitrogen fixation/metabolism regulation signal transduction histidine kinase